MRSRARYHHGDLRAELIATAYDLVRSGGSAALTTRACATRNGVASSAVFRHFPDRRSLATAVAVLGFRHLVCEVQAALSRKDEATTLLTIGAAYLRFALNEPHLFRLMYSGDEIDPMDPALMAASVPLLTLTADAAGAAGPDSDATVLSWAIVHGLATLVLDSQLEGLIPADREAKWQRLMAVLNLALPMFDQARRPPV